MDTRTVFHLLLLIATAAFLNPAAVIGIWFAIQQTKPQIAGSEPERSRRMAISFFASFPVWLFAVILEAIYFQP